MSTEWLPLDIAAAILQKSIEQVSRYAATGAIDSELRDGRIFVNPISIVAMLMNRESTLEKLVHIRRRRSGHDFRTWNRPWSPEVQDAMEAQGKGWSLSAAEKKVLADWKAALQKTEDLASAIKAMAKNDLNELASRLVNGNSVASTAKKEKKRA